MYKSTGEAAAGKRSIVCCEVLLGFQFPTICFVQKNWSLDGL